MLSRGVVREALDQFYETVENRPLPINFAFAVSQPRDGNFYSSVIAWLRIGLMTRHPAADQSQDGTLA
jgi:hypothetical protein